jgi:hypothetical protein
MEAMSRMMDKAISGSLLSGFTVGTEESSTLQVSHLLFADDTLIFCAVEPNQILNLRYLLTWFEAISSLKVNLAKSELVPVSDVPHIEDLAAILECRNASLPLKYLGLPLGAKFKAQTIWDGVLEIMERRLAGWKRMYLSKGGRLTLIKSTLSNLPTYFLSLFPIPVSVAQRMEKLQRDFLWGGLGDEFKFHLVKWDQICQPIQNGGLAVRNLTMFNAALLGKWLWRYGCERDALWRRVIEMKYGSEVGGRCTAHSRAPYGVSLWKHISKGWDKFSKYIRFEVGEGRQLRFLHDLWCGETILREVYPDLYRIACDKDALVANHMQVCNATTLWNLDFIRESQDWEIDSISSLLNLLYSTKVKGSGVDTICWMPKTQKGFQVSSYYRVLTRRGVVCFPWRSIWKSKAPSRICFFVWVASLGEILTADNLQRRNIIMVSWCYLCKINGETTNHVLLHCPYAKEVWDMVFGMFGVHWVMPRKTIDLLAYWQGSFGQHQHFEIWKCIPHCLMWCLWRERNSRSFEGIEKNVADLKLLVLRTLFEWVSASCHFPCTTFLEFLDLCSFQV